MHFFYNKETSTKRINGKKDLNIIMKDKKNLLGT